MRLSDIIQIAREYMVPGIIVALLLSVIAVVGYFVIYKKMMKGQKRLAPIQVLCCVILVIYIVIVLGATLGIRPDGIRKVMNMKLFSSYEEAWFEFGYPAWRLLILNIIMFIPVGFLLPMVSRRFQVWWRTYFWGFAFTLIIETTQYFTGRGVAEADDLLNNAVGSFIGYGLGMFVIWCWQRFRKSQITVSLKKMLFSQIPIGITIIGFSTVFLLYGQKELGNLPYAESEGKTPATVTMADGVTITGEQKALMVYKSTPVSAKEAAVYAEACFQKYGSELDSSRNNIYDDCGVYYSKDGNFSMWIYYNGSEIQFSDSRYTGEHAGKAGVADDILRNLLHEIGIEVPDTLPIQDNGKGAYSITAKMVQAGDAYYNGKLTFQLDQSGKLVSVGDYMVKCRPYKTFPSRSQKQAVVKIQEGKYLSYLDGSYDIIINKVQLDYELDSKNYYQPVWRFYCTIGDGNAESSIEIPALSNTW